jgi:hypothetical protein
MRGTVEPAPRCRTAKVSGALQPGEGDGLAKFAAGIEYGTSSRNCSGRLPALPGLPAGANAALPLQLTVKFAISGWGVFLFACPAHSTASLSCEFSFY